MNFLEIMSLIRKKNKTKYQELLLELGVRQKNLDFTLDAKNYCYQCGYISGLEHRLKITKYWR